MINLRLVAVTSLSLFSLLSGSALADPRDDVLEAIGHCTAVADDKARLSCYDALAPRLRDALAKPPEKLDHPPTEEEQKSWFGFDLGDIFGTSPSQQTTPQQFGSDQIPRTEPPAGSAAATPELDSITAGVTDYSFTPFKKFIVFLDNGQVWRQMQADTGLAHFQRNPKDNQITVERGAFGSYNMFVNGGHEAFKVTRVK